MFLISRNCRFAITADLGCILRIHTVEIRIAGVKSLDAVSQWRQAYVPGACPSERNDLRGQRCVIMHRRRANEEPSWPCRDRRSAASGGLAALSGTVVARVLWGSCFIHRGAPLRPEFGAGDSSGHCPRRLGSRGDCDSNGRQLLVQSGRAPKAGRRWPSDPVELIESKWARTSRPGTR